LVSSGTFFTLRRDSGPLGGALGELERIFTIFRVKLHPCWAQLWRLNLEKAQQNNQHLMLRGQSRKSASASLPRSGPMWLPYSKYHMFAESLVTSIWMTFASCGHPFGSLSETLEHSGSISDIKNVPRKSTRKQDPQSPPCPDSGDSIVTSAPVLGNLCICRYIWPCPV